MKYTFIITTILLAVMHGLFAADPTSGQWLLQKKNAGAGFSNFGVTGENSKAFGLDGSGVPSMLTVGTGTVTSVGITLPSATFDVSGSPVTGSGTLAVTFDNQTGNVVFASPANGSSGQPVWRTLVASDIPDLTSTYATAAQGIKADNVGAVNGIIKSNGSATFSAAVAGTDYLTPSGNGSSLTALNATQLTSGTIPDARFPATLPVASGANLTSLNGSNISTGTVAPARLGSGSSITTKFLRGDSTWQTVSSGGQLSEWAFVDPVNGNDTTGDGTAGNPWATLQKAAGTEGRDFIVLAPGDAGGLTLSAAKNLTILGPGRDSATIGTITVSGSGNLKIEDAGSFSFTAGNITMNPVVSGQSSGVLYAYGIYSPTGIWSTWGASSIINGQAGGNGGGGLVVRCQVAALSCAGGVGGSGDGGTVSGDGGSAGNWEIQYSQTGDVSAAGGPPGTDGGAGQGSFGTDGEVKSRFSTIETLGTHGSEDIHATLLGGTWID